MDPKEQIEFLERVIKFIQTGNGELAIRALDFSRKEFTVLVLSGQEDGGLTLEEKKLAIGKPIQAIKAFRDRAGGSLVDAKDVVEKYRRKSGITEPITGKSQ